MRSSVVLFLCLLAGGCTKPVPTHPPVRLQSVNADGLYLLLTDTVSQTSTIYHRDDVGAQVAKGTWKVVDGSWEWQQQAYAMRDSLVWLPATLPVKRLHHVELTVYDDPIWNTRQAGVQVQVIGSGDKVLARGVTKENGGVALFYPNAMEQLDVPEMLENIIRMAEGGAVAAAEQQLAQIAMPPGLSKPLGPYRLQLMFGGDTIQLPLEQKAAHLKYYRSSSVKPWNLDEGSLTPLHDDRNLFYKLQLTDHEGVREFQVRQYTK